MTNKKRWPATTSSSLTESLKHKSRKRRDSLQRLSAVEPQGPYSRNDLLPELRIVQVPVAKLKLPEQAVRNDDPAHIREVARAIQIYGYIVPLLIGVGNLVLDGQIRLLAAKQLGLTAIPCILLEHLNVDEQRQVRLAVNRLQEKGEWNLPELKLELSQLVVNDDRIELPGFAPDEIDHILLVEEVEAVETGPLEPSSQVAARARPGDLFQLGPHRVICGDATDPEVVARLMQGTNPARLILTDPPYNVPVAGHVTSGQHREFAMASGEMTPDEFRAFNQRWLARVLRYLVDGGLVAAFMDWRGLFTLEEAARSLDLLLLNLVVWAKANAGMGSLYRSQHELLPLWKYGKLPHVNNVALGKRGRWRSNVWHCPGASSLGSDARRGLTQHPTVKPTSMLQDALLDLTHRGDIVLDPFLGSGSTLMAAEATGRVCHGVEIDPLYVDVILVRFEQATGQSASLIEPSPSLKDAEEAEKGEPWGGAT